MSGLSTIKGALTDHPASVGETYSQHLGVATGFGISMILGGLACLVHGILPCLFVKTGSNVITDLHRRMVAHRDRRCAGPSNVATSAFARRSYGLGL